MASTDTHLLYLISHQVPPRFGLKDDSSARWQKLLSHIRQLNATAEDGVLYKLFILGRHGQGYRT